MGVIDDNRNKRKHKDTESPLGNIGDRKQNTNKFDIDEKTIRDQKK